MRLLGLSRFHFLALLEILFESFVVHVQIAHRLLLSSIRSTFEAVDELLVVYFQLIFNALLFVLQIVHRVADEMLALNLGVVQVQLLQRLFKSLVALVFEPVLQVLHPASGTHIALWIAVDVIWALGLVGGRSGTTYTVASDT